MKLLECIKLGRDLGVAVDEHYRNGEVRFTFDGYDAVQGKGIKDAKRAVIQLLRLAQRNPKP